MLEISDLIVDYDAATGERRDVCVADVVGRLEASGQRGAIAIVRALPHENGVLSREACDRALIRAHTELQRLSEEFLQGERLRLLLEPMLGAMRAAGITGPYRVVDVGCGLGYVVRTLAASGGLGDDVTLMGCDYNRALVDEAARLARAERLSCRFACANAFQLDAPAHLFMSTGVLHHFRGDALDAFFANQASAYGFVHYDIQPSPLSPLGAWMFHRARMRELLARHDGIVSAARAHTSKTLLTSARRGAIRVAAWDDARSFASVLLRPMHAVVGLRPELVDPFRSALGTLAARLGAFA